MPTLHKHSADERKPPKSRFFMKSGEADEPNKIALTLLQLSKFRPFETEMKPKMESAAGT